MAHLITFIVLAVLAMAGISLQKSYGMLPVKELKRRAQQGDASATALYRAASYGVSLRVLLWAVIGLASAGLFLLIANTTPWPLALIIIIGYIWLAFAWLPRMRAGAAGNKLAIWLTPAVAKLLGLLHPVLDMAARLAGQNSHYHIHTTLYQKEDLLELLDLQAKQSDNRITKDELNIVRHALTFGDKLVRDIFIPQSQVVMVNIADTIGPVLMDELHDSGHSRFPVYDGKKERVVGILYLHDLVSKDHGGPVRDIVKKHITYVHEEQTLNQTLQAFLKTKRHLFMVVNRFEEIIGIITIEDILEQIIGQQIMDEFDQYEDLRAVAARMADKIHKQENH